MSLIGTVVLVVVLLVVAVVGAWDTAATRKRTRCGDASDRRRE